jgi:hypothetical protein
MGPASPRSIIWEVFPGMAKRSRGSSRPGRRGPKARSPRPAAPARPNRPATALSQTEEARAAELEAQIVAQERAAESELLRARTSSRARDEALSAGPPGRARSGGLLAARATEEYTYVVRDVRRIVTVGGGLILIMAVLFLLIDVLNVIKL